jgi:glycosyltransferase involved in cell wall biosynthesis
MPGASPVTSRTALQLVANLDRGGGQEVVRTLAAHLPGHGWRPVVVSLRDGPLRAEIEARGATVEIVDGERRSILSGPAGLRDLRRIQRTIADAVERHNAEVVQTHLLRAVELVTLPLRRPHRRAVVWTVHNAMLDLRADQVPGGQRWLLAAKRVAHRTAYRAGVRRVDAVVAVSDDVAAAVRRGYRPPHGRLVTIANGVDVERYPASRDPRLRGRLGLDDNAKVVIVVAKLMRQKGHAVLLEALSAGAFDPGMQVLFVGDGPEREALVAETARLGLDHTVHFLGDRPDVPALLAIADLFVLPSLWEGLPMALLEAMASGLPVVATKVAGSRQVISDDSCGLLVPPGDPGALRAAMYRLLGDDGLSAEIGRAGRERTVSAFSGAAQARQHADLYDRCLGGNL